MATIQDQKKRTGGKGWGVVNWAREQPYKVLGEYAKEKKKQITDKVTKIVEGIKATPSFIKKNLKKKGKD